MSTLVLPPKGINQNTPIQLAAKKIQQTNNNNNNTTTTTTTTIQNQQNVKKSKLNQPTSISTTIDSASNFNMQNSDENKVQQLMEQLSKMKPLKSTSLSKKPISVKYLDIKTITSKKENNVTQKSHFSGVDRIEEENVGEDDDAIYANNDPMDLESNTNGINERNTQFERLYGKDYDNFVLNEELSLENSLKNSKVSDDMRSRMVDWIIEVYANYYQTTSDETFFKTILLMDAYIKYNQDKVVEDQDIHLLGIACMFIASKYEDIYHIPLGDFFERIAHKKFQADEIKQKEYEVLRAVKFKLSQPTSLKMLYRFIFKSFKNEKNSILENITISSIYMLKMCLHDYQFQNYRPQILALSALIFTIKTLFHEFYETKPQNKKELQAQENYLISGIMSTPCEQTDGREVEKCMIKMQSLFINFQKKYANLTNLKKFCNF